MLKVANHYDEKYGDRQQLWYEFELEENYKIWSQTYSLDGTLINTLRYRQYKNRIEQQYVAADGDPITTLFIFEDHFEVVNHSPNMPDERKILDFEDNEHLIEHFERDGLHVSFESLKATYTGNGNLLAYSNDSRRWVFETDTDGKRLKCMYKNGNLQRVRYIEELFEPVSLSLVFPVD